MFQWTLFYVTHVSILTSDLFKLIFQSFFKFLYSRYRIFCYHIYFLIFNHFFLYIYNFSIYFKLPTFFDFNTKLIYYYKSFFFSELLRFL